MSPSRSSIRNAGAPPFYAPYREEGGYSCSPANKCEAERKSAYFRFSSLTRRFSRPGGYSSLFSSPSVRGILAVLGGILVHICLGTVYTWGTLAVYVISYMRLLQEERSTYFLSAEIPAAGETAVEATPFQEVYTQPSPAEVATNIATVRLSDAAWVVACQFAGMALAMPLGGKVERKVGPCKTVLVGGAIMCAAVAAAPHVLHNYLLFLACYGVMQGAGLGLAYTAPLVCGLSWFPNRKGVVSGAITAGFGTGALLFSPLQAAYLNPLNLPPTYSPYPSHPAELYYDPHKVEERSVLLRIPSLMQRLAVAYLLLLGVGAALLQPASPSSKLRGEKKKGMLYVQPFQAAAAEEDEAEPGREEEEGGAAAMATVLEGGGRVRRRRRAGEVQEGAAEAEDLRCRGEKLQVKAALCSSPFWCLWGLFFLNGLAICFTASFWRFLAVDRASRTYILTEAQLALVGAAASASNAAGRIAWGQVVDSKGFRVALTILSAIWSGLLLYLPTAALHGGLAYGATVCGSFFCLGGNFAVFPSAVAALFGRDAVGHLYGYVFTSQLGSSLCFAFLTQRVVQ